MNFKNKSAKLIFENFILLILIIILPSKSFCQSQKVQNLPVYDYKTMHFGFSLGLSINDFRVTRSYPLSDTVYVVETGKEPGFSLGIVSNFRFLHWPLLPEQWSLL
jgi:hypothetical protein